MKSDTRSYLGLITGALAILVFILSCVAFFVVRRGRKKVALLHKHTTLVSGSAKSVIPTTAKDGKPAKNRVVFSGGLSSKGGKKSSGENSARKEIFGDGSESENSSVYHEPYKLLPSDTTTVSNRDYGCLLKTGIRGERTGELLLSLMLFLYGRMV